MFYRLRDSCRLVEGANRGAIYDLQTGKVYSINRSAVDLLNDCLKMNLEEVTEDSEAEKAIVLDFLHQLTEKEVGSFFINEPRHTEYALRTDIVPSLDFLWLELTSVCNNKCLHCYATSGPDVLEDSVSLERWLNLIHEAATLGAGSIQLIGGEPLLYPHWKELVIKASEEKFHFIEVFTNATLIDDDTVDFFKKYGVNVATTIYSDKAAVHDNITKNPGSFSATFDAITKVIAAKIPLRIASIIMKDNEDEVKAIMDLCATLGVEVTPPDVVRPTGRGDDLRLLPEKYKKPSIRPPFMTDNGAFEAAQVIHGCLAGKIAVTSNGDVIPCIFARSQVCGNINSSTLAAIINGDLLQKCWHTTKDKVEKCKDCEYRYACPDCRPLAQGSDPKKCWLACSGDCSYNPYTGTWEDEESCPTRKTLNAPAGNNQK